MLFLNRIISSANWQIDKAWGMQILSSYLHDLDMIQNGVPFSELMYSEKRAESRRIQISNEIEDFSETTLDLSSFEGTIPENSIAELKLSGVMTLEDGLCHQGINSLAQSLQQADNHKSISGVLLEVNSGGGEALAGSVLQNTIRDMKTPVVTYTHFLGSAAVRGTLGTKEIIASSKDVSVGSIGAMISLNLEAIEEHKETYKELYAESSPNKNAEWRALLEGNETPLIKRVTETADFFRSEVKKHRPLKGNIEETLKGGIFTANKAKSKGLIDGIGTKAYAVRRLRTHK